MKLPNYRRPGTNRISLVPKWSLSIKSGLHVIELSVKEVPWESPNNTGCGQQNKLLSKNWAKGFTAKNNTCTMHWKQRSWAGAYLESSPQHLVFLELESTLHTMEKTTVNTNPASFQPFDLQWGHAREKCWRNGGIKISPPTSDLI